MNPFTEQNEAEFLEMASLSSKVTGIEKVVIWAGPDPHAERLRIKISNKSNFQGKDLFTLTIPDYQVFGRINEELIRPEDLEKVKHWCEKNMEAIVDYSIYKTSTDEFLKSLVPL